MSDDDASVSIESPRWTDEAEFTALASFDSLSATVVAAAGTKRIASESSPANSLSGPFATFAAAANEQRIAAGSPAALPPSPLSMSIPIRAIARPSAAERKPFLRARSGSRHRRQHISHDKSSGFGAAASTQSGEPLEAERLFRSAARCAALQRELETALRDRDSAMHLSEKQTALAAAAAAREAAAIEAHEAAEAASNALRHRLVAAQADREDVAASRTLETVSLASLSGKIDALLRTLDATVSDRDYINERLAVAEVSLRIVTETLFVERESVRMLQQRAQADGVLIAELRNSLSTAGSSGTDTSAALGSTAGSIPSTAQRQGSTSFGGNRAPAQRLEFDYEAITLASAEARPRKAPPSLPPAESRRPSIEPSIGGYRSKVNAHPAAVLPKEDTPLAFATKRREPRQRQREQVAGTIKPFDPLAEPEILSRSPPPTAAIAIRIIQREHFGLHDSVLPAEDSFREGNGSFMSPAQYPFRCAQEHRLRETSRGTPRLAAVATESPSAAKSHWPRVMKLSADGGTPSLTARTSSESTISDTDIRVWAAGVAAAVGDEGRATSGPAVAGGALTPIRVGRYRSTIERLRLACLS